MGGRAVVCLLLALLGAIGGVESLVRNRRMAEAPAAGNCTRPNDKLGGSQTRMNDEAVQTSVDVIGADTVPPLYVCVRACVFLLPPLAPLRYGWVERQTASLTALLRCWGPRQQRRWLHHVSDQAPPECGRRLSVQRVWDE